MFAHFLSQTAERVPLSERDSLASERPPVAVQRTVEFLYFSANKGPADNAHGAKRLELRWRSVGRFRPPASGVVATIEKLHHDRAETSILPSCLVRSTVRIVSRI